ncbi:MAG: dethiobiotin synthase [Burkholderiales bacterium]|nr:dethiobiotin synthase [Burkholderiales bacterium]
MPHGLFITGTDTEVGKTLVACALIHACRRAGMRVVAMKPVAAGCYQTQDGWKNEDVEALRAAADVDAPLDEINPYRFVDAIAPHIAASRTKVAIDLPVIRERFDLLSRRADAVIVEGAGGFLVPLNEREDFGDLARALALPVVLTVGMRLGCINHALLTQEAILARGLPLVGWVANRIDPAMSVFDENLETLKQRLKAPLLGVVPRMDRPDASAVRLDLPNGQMPSTSFM